MTYFVDGGIIDWGRQPYGTSGDIPQPTGTYERLRRHYFVNDSRQVINWESWGTNASPVGPTGPYERLKRHHYSAHEHQIIWWESWGNSEPPAPPPDEEVTQGGHWNKPRRLRNLKNPAVVRKPEPEEVAEIQLPLVEPKIVRLPEYTFFRERADTIDAISGLSERLRMRAKQLREREEEDELDAIIMAMVLDAD